ncbi:calcium-binding protein, partial [Pelagimonas varians]
MADLSGLATPFNDLIKGNGEDDTLVGLAGNDTLRGNGGTNIYTGGLGDDVFFISSLATLETITDFASGEDVLNVQDLGLTYFSEFDSVTSTAAGTTLVEGGTTIYLDGVTSVTASDFDFLSINGTVGPDLLIGDGTENKFRGLEGNDTLIGLEGDDELRGGEGDDRVFGGDDNDLVVGGANNDTVHGGDGNDDVRGGTDDDILRG